MEARPDDAEARLDLTFDLSDIGRCYENLGDRPAALDHYRQVVPIRQGLVAADERDMRVRLRLAYSLLRVAWLEQRSGKSPAAGDLFRQAAEHCGVVLAANAADANALSYRAEARLGIGLATARTRGRPAGCPHLVQAGAEFRALAARGPLRKDEEEYAAEAAREAAACRAPAR